MARKSDIGIALKIFITELRFPEWLTIDVSKEKNVPVTYFMKSFRRNYIQTAKIEPEQPNQNPAEGVIR